MALATHIQQTDNYGIFILHCILHYIVFIEKKNKKKQFIDAKCTLQTTKNICMCKCIVDAHLDSNRILENVGVSITVELNEEDNQNDDYISRLLR